MREPNLQPAAKTSQRMIEDVADRRAAFVHQKKIGARASRAGPNTDWCGQTAMRDQRKNSEWKIAWAC
jgi:hypothetical protein